MHCNASAAPWVGMRPVSDRRRRSGFTLLELMIVVLVIAILASLAIAGYDFAVLKTRRSAAQGCLAEAAQFMERFYTTNLNYQTDLAGASVSLPRCSADVTPHYAVGFMAGQPTATTFTIAAIPQGGQAREKSCGTMTVNEKGLRTPADGCW